MFFRNRVVLSALIAVASVSCSRTPPAPEGPALTIFYNAEEQPTEKNAVSQLLQAQLRANNIIVKLDPVSNTLYNDRLAKGDFESTLNLWYLDYDDPEGFLTDFYSKAGYRSAKYESPEYDKTYLAGLAAPTDTEKMALFRSAVGILQHDLPWIPLYSNTEIFLLGKGASGFSSNAYQYYDYRRVDLPSVRASSDVEVQTLDPALAYDLASKHLVTQSYEGLVALDAQSKLVPALATSWEYSPNMDRIKFALRHGVRFHDTKDHPGREMTSDDVKASFERMLQSTSPYTYIFDNVEGVDSFKAGKTKDVSGFKVNGPYEFSIVLKRPLPTMIHWLLAPAADILPKGTPVKFDFSKGSIGTGPFVLQSWDGVTSRFSGNPAYWQRDPSGRAVPFSKSLTIRIMKEVNTASLAFQHGELDVLNAPTALYNQLFTSEGQVKPDWGKYEIREVRLNNLKFIAFNMQKRPWGSDLALRQRVAQAINRQEIVQKLLFGKGRPATTVIPSGIPGFE